VELFDCDDGGGVHKCKRVSLCRFVKSHRVTGWRRPSDGRSLDLVHFDETDVCGVVVA